MKRNNSDFADILGRLGDSLVGIQAATEMAEAAAENLPLRRIADHAGKIEGVIKSVDSAIKELKDVIGKLKNEGTVPTDEEADELITSVKKAVGDLQVLIGDGD